MPRGGVPRGASRGALALALLAGALLLFSPSPARAQQTEADVLVAQAILAYEDRRYDEALALLREALAQDPDNLAALYYTGLTLLAQEKPLEAVGPLERARQRAPADLAVLYQLGVAYFALKDYDRAEEPLTEVFRAQPQLPWWGTRLKYDYDVHFRNYSGLNSIFPVDSPTKKSRSDTEQTHVVRIEQPLPAGFTLSFEYQGIVARSSLPIFSYNRSIFSMLMSWQY